MSSFVEFIKSQVDISDDALAALVEKTETRTYAKGEHLFMPDDGCDDYFFINEGFARVYHVNDKGADMTVWFVGKHNFSSTLHGLEPHKRRPNSCELLQDSVVTIIRHADVINLISEYHELAMVLVLMLFGVSNRFVNLMTSLKRSAKEKLSDLLIDTPNIFQEAPAMHIASYLGVTPETLSRIKSEVLMQVEA
ncbi:MAG: Crp/Fnr family transcriptional regulator [Mangrovibacterium sp.]